MLHYHGIDRLAHDLAHYTPAVQPDPAAASVNADATERAWKVERHAHGRFMVSRVSAIGYERHEDRYGLPIMFPSRSFAQSCADNLNAR